MIMPGFPSKPCQPLPTCNSRPPTFFTPFCLADAEAIHMTLDHPLLNNVLISIPKPYTIEYANLWINLQLSGSKDPCLLLQALRAENPDSGCFIGAVSLTPMLAQAVRSSEAQDWYELGYYLHPDYHGKGIMKDAVRVALAWALRERGVENLLVRATSSNERSRRLIGGSDGFVRDEGDEEIKWPENKGGGKQNVTTWRQWASLADG